MLLRQECGSMEHMELEALRRELEGQLELAYQSRKAGREGRARVQARILAGRAVEAYAHSELGLDDRLNAWQWLKWLEAREDLPPNMNGAAQRLTVRVTPAFTLPHPEDPLLDAQQIVEDLLGRMGSG